MSDTLNHAPNGAPEGARADVIHDIGYRHYEGPRLGPGYATRSLYTSSLRGAFGLGRSGKSKILPMAMCVIMALPAVIMVAVSVYLKSGKLPIEYTYYLTIMQFVIAVFTAAQAPVLFSRDLRFMTVPLYFSRPLRSSDYVRAKFAAMASAVFILTMLPMLIMWIGSLLGSMAFTYNLEHFSYGVLAAAFYALVYAGIGSLLASLTPRRGFGVAAIIATFMVSQGLAQAIFGVMRFKGHVTSGHWVAMLNPGMLIDSTVQWIFNVPNDRPNIGVPSTLGGVVFLVWIGVLVVGTFALLVRRYRKI
ncbi:ABC transporter permease [Streptacidiphilus fuscans]|uniref:ABC transporter permease n=1 Tax=Streptacidiphilus fuscans TaxID=2789292 RepID=A0A931B621_9ACTN|nr:ABC transporter permease [Streptacidiphilus fuscans]MBF9070841.1 ABC transporter permease [Streptacidiphilus fuscans]